MGTMVDWAGAHSSRILPRLLKRIAGEEKSGDLKFSFGEAVKTVTFNDGAVIFAASNVKDDRLGESMMARGFISERDYLVASELMRTEGRRFGEALVRMRLISRDELEKALQFQFERIIQSLFLAEIGIYRFEEGRPPVPDDVEVRLPVRWVLLESLRKLPNRTLVFSFLPEPDHRVRTASNAYSILDRQALGGEERAILDAAVEGTTIQSLLRRIEGDASALLRACGSLYAAGFLEPETLPTVSELRHRIDAELDRTDRLNEWQILDVQRGVGLDAVHRIYQSQVSEWSRVRRLVRDEEALDIKISEILFRLAAAYFRLRCEKERTDRSNPSPEGAGARDDGQATCETIVPSASETTVRLTRQASSTAK